MQRQLAGVFVLTSCALAAVVAQTLPSGVDLLVAHEQIDRPFKWYSDLEARVQALTAAEINAAFRKRIDPGSLSIVKAATSSRPARTPSASYFFLPMPN